MTEEADDMDTDVGGAGGVEGPAEQEEMSLEARLGRLDDIVAALEGGEVELEEGLALFEEGVRHIREAEALLTRAELRVEELLGDVDALRTRSVDPSEE